MRDSSVVILAYIFPRQFGLHNVFTSAIDSRQTVQPFKDYMTREDELSARRRASKGDLKIPKRLRGKAVELVKILQLLHERCPYDSLINYYCPHVVCSRVGVE